MHPKHTGPYCSTEDARPELEQFGPITFLDWNSETESYAVISLDPGEIVHFTQGGPTDEGWSSEHTSYKHAGHVIECERDSDGVDCDGRLGTSASFHCPIPDLRKRTAYNAAAIKLPEWQQGESRQRDYQAEAAGY